MERTVLRLPLSSLPNVDAFFRRLTGVDTEHIPEKYGDSVEQGRAIVLEQGEISMVYRCAQIREKSAAEVLLEGDVALIGQIPPLVLKDSDRVVGFIIRMGGFSGARTDDIMVEYMADAWASAYVECAQAWFAGQVSSWAAENGLARTHLWCPGQHEFPLENQKGLFGLLSPEELGCSLTDHYMMVPVKAVSGIMGITPPDCGMQLKPCDFCGFRKSCPGSDRGCAAL